MKINKFNVNTRKHWDKKHSPVNYTTWAKNTVQKLGLIEGRDYIVKKIHNGITIYYFTRKAWNSAKDSKKYHRYIYICKGADTGVIKVGSTNNIVQRVASLRTENKEVFELLFISEAIDNRDNGYMVENMVHSYITGFMEIEPYDRREYYHMEVEEITKVISYIQKTIKSLGVSVCRM